MLFEFFCLDDNVSYTQVYICCNYGCWKKTYMQVLHFCQQENHTHLVLWHFSAKTDPIKHDAWK